jgi:hypothetical protein
VNPGSLFAQAVTAALSTLVSRWADVLTQAERDGWDALAFGGIPTGLNLYVRFNTLRVQTGVGIIDTPPVTATTAALTSPNVTIASETTQRFTIAYDNTDQWATESGGYLVIYASRPQPPTINFFKGPYRLVEVLAGAVVPPTSPFVSTASSTPFPFVADQKIFFQFRSLLADGRISSVRRDERVAVA